MNIILKVLGLLALLNKSDKASDNPVGVPYPLVELVPKGSTFGIESNVETYEAFSKALNSSYNVTSNDIAKDSEAFEKGGIYIYGESHDTPIYPRFINDNVKVGALLLEDPDPESCMLDQYKGLDHFICEYIDDPYQSEKAIQLDKDYIRILKSFIELISPGTVDLLLPNPVYSMPEIRSTLLDFLLYSLSEIERHGSKDMKRFINETFPRVQKLLDDNNELKNTEIFPMREKTMLKKSSEIIASMFKDRKNAFVKIVVGDDHAQMLYEGLSEKFKNKPVVLARSKSSKKGMKL